MNKRVFSLILLACLLSGAKCQTSPVTPPGGSGSWSDWGSAGTGGGGYGGSVVVDAGGSESGDDCARAEALAEALGCPLKKPKRATWAEACRNGRANGVDMQDDCVLLAKDCVAVHKCTSESAP